MDKPVNENFIAALERLGQRIRWVLQNEGEERRMIENEFSVHEFIVREMGYPGVIKQEVVGELVRCVDCKRRDAENGVCVGRGWPMQLVPDDGFCDKGER